MHKRNLWCFDHDIGVIQKKKAVMSELIQMLKEKVIKDSCGNREKMQEKAKNNNLPIEEDEHIIKEGWDQKPKGELQVLYECEWINPSKIKLYTKNGEKDEDPGQYECSYGYSINKRLMGNLIDF